MTSLLALSVTAGARADEPFTDWADGAGSAVAALWAGDSGAALRASRVALAALTQGEAGARGHLLAARALELDRRPAGAAAELTSALNSLPVTLVPTARERLAADLAAAGRAAEAAAAWALAGSGADPVDRPRLAAAEARAWLAAGEPGRAGQAAATGGGHPAARLALARSWAVVGDPRAFPALRELALEQAGELEGEEAARLLVATAPGTLSVADRIERARHLVSDGRTEAALAEIASVEDANGATPLSSVLRGLALLQAGRPAEAERVASPVARLPGPGEPAAARFVLARAAARQGRIEEAVARYRRVARERPVVPGLTATQQLAVVDDAAFLAAWLPHDLGRHEQVAEALERFLRERPGSRRAPDARWFRAWALFRSGDRPAARMALRRLAERESGNLRAAALYWLARIEPGPEGAAAAYRAAIAEIPGGWYALLSAARLERLDLPVPAVAPPPPSPLPDPPADPRAAAAMALAVDLAGAGLREESVALLQRLSRAPDVRSRAALLAEVAAFAGDAEVPFRMARDHLAPGIRTRRWAFPEAHAEVLSPAARRLGVDPSLALSVMRRESAFVAAARSTAGAEGLFQLRPVTAARLAVLLGVPADVDLSDPAANAPTGVAYLALLADRFATPAQALAAYNAGPSVAEAWSRIRAGLPLDEWVEDIPYRETRQYVRAVLADRARYRLLAGEAPAPLDPAAPVTPPAPGVAF